MATNRRDFIRNAVIGAGVLSTGMIACNPGKKGQQAAPETGKHNQRFNMCGYAAPKVDKVRLGIIGLGHRGPGAVERMSFIENVEITALCDQYGDRVDKCQKILTDKGLPAAAAYSGTKESWKELCNRPDIDLVYICTPWNWHTPMAVYAMEQGKHVACEVPAATTTGECWQLVETSERTRKHCMQLENCCYDFFELLTLNMARQGFFGEIIHGEGAYIHNLMELNFDKDYYAEMWRLKENFKNGNLYPTHGLGPVCQIMNINRGDRMDYLTSLQSGDFQMAAEADRLAASDGFFTEFAGKTYRGNMSTTLVRTVKGRSVMIQHDVTSTRPYSRIHLISGTKGIACKWPSPARISTSHEWMTAEEMKAIEEKFTPEIVRHVGQIAREIGGHGGMDFIMDWRLIDCLRNGLPLDQDVYDAALWSVITPLSLWSVANRAASVDVPDFTCGAWETNPPVSLSLEGGGNTRVITGEKEGDNQLTVG